jgi:hypothetical protein
MSISCPIYNKPPHAERFLIKAISLAYSKRDAAFWKRIALHRRGLILAQIIFRRKIR